MREAATRRPHGPDLPGPARAASGRPCVAPARGIRFGAEVVLTKEEAFGVCQALADAGRVLVRSGGSVEADALCSVFVLLEERLVDG